MASDKLPNLPQPPHGRTVPTTFLEPRATELFEDDVLHETYDPRKGGYVVPAHGTAHPNTAKYPNHKLYMVIPSEDGTTAKWIYTVTSAPIVDKKVSTEYGGGVLTVTKSRAAAGTLTPDTGLVVTDSEVKDLSDGDELKVTEQLSDIIPAKLLLTNGGSGFTSNPAVSFSGGTGSGAVATAQVGYAVASITVSVNGSGYSLPPAVQISGGGGNGARAVALLGFILSALDLTAGGSGYTSAPSVAFAGGSGTGAAATAVLGFGIASYSVTGNGSNYQTPPAVVLSGGGGGSGASANAVLGYPINTLSVTAGGSGYTSAPSVAFAGGGGSGAAATATIDTVVSTTVTVTAGGSGYTSPPTIALSGGGGSGAAATAVLGFGIASASVSAAGSGYTSAPAVGFAGGGGSGATASVTLKQVSAPAVVAGGTGYTVNDILTVTGGTSTTAAQIKVTAVSSGVVTAAIIQTAGNYTVLPSNPVSVTGGTGTGATFTLTWGVLGITITAAGSGYTSAPTLSITGGAGSGAAATAVLATSGAVKSITVTAQGTGYTSAPVVVITGGAGSGATATAAITGIVKSLAITNAGTGYTSAPTISFSGGAGTGAAATATVKNSGPAIVSRIDVVLAGSGYTSAPTVALVPAVGDSGTGATATASLASAGSVISLTLTNPGSGYTSEPTISFSGGAGTGAVARAILAVSGGIVKSITVTNGGSAYRSTPTILLIGGDGSGATATAVLASTGSVVILTLTSAGNYTVAPTVVFTGGGGSGAAATYVLPVAAKWPTLYGNYVDPVEAIVIDIEKTVVDAGTPYPGGFTDITPMDKWRSLQIVSKVDLSTLPAPLTYASSHQISLPDTLLSVEGLWSDATASSSSYQQFLSKYGVIASANAVVTSASSGDIVVRVLQGYRGVARAQITRSFLSAPPSLSDIPSPTIIKPVSGTASMFAKSSTTKIGVGTGSGLSASDFQFQTHSTSIRDVLVPGIIPVINGSHRSPAVSALAVTQDSDGSTLTAGLLAFGTDSMLSVQMPVSSPPIVSGQVILVDAPVEKWRFGIYVLHVIRVIVP